MKRKIFTLLVAFMALAAFQANAQYGLAVPYVLDVISPTTSGVNAYWNAPWVGNMGTPQATDTGALTLGNNNVFSYKKTAGQFANLSDYFSIDSIGNQQFVFRAYDASGNPGELFQIGGQYKWEVVNFDLNSGLVTAKSPLRGGYVCVPSAVAGDDPGRQILVRERTTGELKLITYTQYQANGGAAWTALTGAKYIPVWVQARHLTGRWAQKMDFYNTFPDFIQVKDSKGGVLQARGSNNKMYNKFKVALTGTYTWKGAKMSALLGIGAADSVSVSKGPEVTYTAGNSTDIHLFSFISPEDGSKLLTVARSRNAFDNQYIANNNTNGDSLILAGDYHLWGTSAYPSVGTGTPNLDPKTQQFAIWIEADGTLTLYPRAAYTYTFGGGNIRGNEILQENLSILYNAPVVQTGYITTPTANAPLTPATSWADACFKIGCLKGGAGNYVVGPTDLSTSTLFDIVRGKFNFIDVTTYNKVDQKRYFYLESKIMGRDGKPLVVDVVKQIASDGTIQKKVVLTDREANRFIRNGNDTAYYNTPYDSLNMSACWAISYVYNTDLDITIPSQNKQLIGYLFVNEEGDTLRYNQSGTDPATGLPLVLSNKTETNAYLLKDTVNSTLIRPTSDVWKAISFTDDTDGYFFLTNLKDAPLRDTIDNNIILKTKELRGWDVRLDTMVNKYNLTVADGVNVRTPYLYPYSPIMFTWDAFLSQTYFRSGTTISSFYPNCKDAARTTYYNEPYWYHNVRYNGIDSVMHRNIGIYDYQYNGNKDYYNDATGWNANPGDGVYYLNNTFGLELRVAEIHVNKDINVAPHDSVIDGKNRWDRYEVDSLWTYFYKKPGTYAIKEALGWNDLLKSYSSGSRMAYMGLPDVSTDTIHLELADSAVLTKLQGTDNCANQADIQADPLHAKVNYKWYYISKIIPRANGTGVDTFYLTYNSVRPNFTDYRQYGFSFSETIKANASPFRFYQPLVADKEQKYFILETIVPDWYYSDNNGTIDVRGNRGFSNKGEVRYAILETGSENIGVTANAKEATRWDFVRYGDLPQCRIDYIDNDFLADTKMYGAPLTAERYDRGKYTGDSITTSAREGHLGDNGPVSDTTVTFTLVPAAKIEAKYRSPLTGNYGRINGYYYSNDTTDCYVMGDETRDVQLYYVRQITRTSAGADTTYLTVTDENVFVQSLQSQKKASVSGDVLRFEDYHSYNNMRYGANSYTNDSTLLQMFAVYGKLGEDPDRGTSCITPGTDRPFSFGQFFFVPAAAYKYNFQTKQTIALERNLKIGNRQVDDEFRVGVYSERNSKYLHQMIVVPAKVDEGYDGEPAAEYIFAYVPFKDKFNCANFVEDAVGNDIACDGRAVNHHDYADPSVQWTINKLSENPNEGDFYVYSFNPVATQRRNQSQTVHTSLTDDYYLFLIDSTATEYGGYRLEFTSVKKYYKDPSTNKYVFGQFADDVKLTTVTEITNKHIGDVKQVKGTDRIYNGDSTIDYFRKFTDGETISFEWGITESVYTNRYLWGKDYNDPIIIGFDQAYADTVRPDKPGRFLKIVKSNIDTIADCNGKIIHMIPYYNIVYSNPNDGYKYYLVMRQDGTVQFERMTDQLIGLMTNSARTYRPEMKFCFPYKMKEYNSIEYVGEGDNADPAVPNTKDTNPYYDYEKVFIQSMVTATTPKPVILKLEGDSKTISGEVHPDLFSLDYMLKLGATNWFFKKNGNEDDVWVKLSSKEGWLRDAKRGEGSDYFVTVTPNPANGVNFAYLPYKSVIEGGVDMAKLTFELVSETYLGSYDPKRIWYYNIKNAEGKYLTSAGFNPGKPGTKPADSLVWQGEGYAYFTDKLPSDPQFRQLFGLKYIKPAATVTADPWNFWVVAGVDSLVNNDDNSEYFYLASKNDALTFRYGSGTTKQATEASAMMFEFGQVKDDVYTDIDNVDANKPAIYGIEGAVQINNITGIVELYTVDGRLFKSVKATGAAQTVPAPRGVVLVKANGETTKVIVK